MIKIVEDKARPQFSKGDYVVTKRKNGPGYVWYRVETVSTSPLRSSRGWVYGEHLQDFDNRSVVYVAKNEADAENYCNSHN